MSSLRERPKTALLVVDVQNDVVANAHRRDEVIANINTLVGKARAEDVAVIWVQHADDNLVRGSESWQYVPEFSNPNGGTLTFTDPANPLPAGSFLTIVIGDNISYSDGSVTIIAGSDVCTFAVDRQDATREGPEPLPVA